jgi:23S rRNA pseudouridine955/2504/2580 synthase
MQGKSRQTGAFSPQEAPETAHGVRQVEVGEERDGQRLDNFLFGLLKGVPKTHVYRLLRTGQVRING